MKPAVVGRALKATGLTPQASRLLTHMADVADDRGLFYESRTRTAHLLNVHPETIKQGLRALVDLGYVSEEHAARKGRAPRMIRLHPDRWPQPEPLASSPGLPVPDLEQPEVLGIARVRDALARAPVAAPMGKRITSPDMRKRSAVSGTG